MWGYCNSVSVALPGENSDQLSFHENIRISRYSSKSLKVIEGVGISHCLCIDMQGSSWSFLQHLSWWHQGGVERQNFNPKINIKFTFTTKHRTLLLLLLRYKMAPGMCLSLFPRNIQRSKESHRLMPSQQFNLSFRNPPLTLYPPSSSRPDLQRGYWYLPGIRMSTCMIHQTKKRGAS